MVDGFIPVVINATAFISAQYKQMLAGVKEAAAKAGNKIQVFTEEGFDTLDTSRWPKVIIATGTSLPFLRHVINRMEGEGRRVVLSGTDSDQFGNKVSCATHSRRAEMLQALEYLSQWGKRRIALVGFNDRSINDRHRYYAALSAEESLGIPLSIKDVFTWSKNPESCFEAFKPHFSHYEAVICPNDVLAVCFTNFCRNQGVKIPNELFVFSFGGMQLSRWASPSITTTTMDDYQVGQQAVTVWSFILKNHLQGLGMRITLPGSIIPRESTAYLKQQTSPPISPQKEMVDIFYSVPLTAALVQLDDCLSHRDELDFKVLHLLMSGDSYETISEKLFISISALRYRLQKIYSEAGANSREKFESKIRFYLGNVNPFSSITIK